MNGTLNFFNGALIEHSTMEYIKLTNVILATVNRSRAACLYFGRLCQNSITHFIGDHTVDHTSTILSETNLFSIHQVAQKYNE